MNMRYIGLLVFAMPFSHLKADVKNSIDCVAASIVHLGTSCLPGFIAGYIVYNIMTSDDTAISSEIQSYRQLYNKSSNWTQEESLARKDILKKIFSLKTSQERALTKFKEAFLEVATSIASQSTTENISSLIVSILSGSAKGEEEFLITSFQEQSSLDPLMAQALPAYYYHYNALSAACAIAKYKSKESVYEQLAVVSSAAVGAVVSSALFIALEPLMSSLFYDDIKSAVVKKIMKNLGLYFYDKFEQADNLQAAKDIAGTADDVLNIVSTDWSSEKCGALQAINISLALKEDTNLPEDIVNVYQELKTSYLSWFRY